MADHNNNDDFKFDIDDMMNHGGYAPVRASGSDSRLDQFDRQASRRAQAGFEALSLRNGTVFREDSKMNTAPNRESPEDVDMAAQEDAAQEEDVQEEDVQEEDAVQEDTF